MCRPAQWNSFAGLFEDRVVDQPRRANVRRNRKKRAGRGNFNRQQSGPINRLDVINTDVGLGRENFAPSSNESSTTPLALCNNCLNMTNGAAERESLGSLGWVQVNIAGADGKTIGIANDGAHHNFDCKPQIGDHPSQHGDLCRVLLAKKCAIGFGRNQELGNNSGDAAKVARPRCSVEAIAEVRNFDEC